MNNLLNFKKLKFIGGLVVLAMLYMYFSSPRKVVVDEQGNIKGILNSARESIQGKAFWRDQLIKVSNEIEWELGEPQRQAKLNQEIIEMMRESNQSMEETYQKYPKMRPTKSELQAEVLRKKADQIEQQEMDNYLESMRIQRISKLRKILPLVKEKAE